jgi:predicted anti-sigma-YlaC factor YlaD
MSDLACAAVEQAATEYALGILPSAEAREVSDHLAVCPACRIQVDQTRLIGERLLDLVPDAEPPLGFDRKVMAGMKPSRRGRAFVLAGGLAVAAALAVIVGLVALSGHPKGSGDRLSAQLRQNGQVIGSVYVDGNPPWVSMTVRDVGLTGTVTCQLVTPSGAAVTVGEFEVVHGRGAWSAPDPATGSYPVAARLVGPDGNVLATATFPVGSV